MEILATLRDEDVGLNTKKPFKLREERFAARAIICDDDDMIALLVSGNGLSYRIPGGGLKPKEAKRGDYLSAAVRESREETGLKIEIENELGIIVEERAKQGLRQVNAYYLAYVVDKQKRPRLTRPERRLGLTPTWDHIYDAYDRFSNPHPMCPDGKFMLGREALVLYKVLNDMAALV